MKSRNSPLKSQLPYALRNPEAHPEPPDPSANPGPEEFLETIWSLQPLIQNNISLISGKDFGHPED